VTVDYSALDRHVEALGRPRHLAQPKIVGLAFLRGGTADGRIVECYRHPAPGAIHIPFCDGFWGNWRYELRTLVWGAEGFEGGYAYVATIRYPGSKKAKR
jgi:hypothetical protein